MIATYPILLLISSGSVLGVLLGFLIAMAGATFQTERVFVGIGMIASFGIVRLESQVA